MTKEIEDYLTEEERREIAKSAFKQTCLDTFKADAERIFSNAAHHSVLLAMNEAFDGKVVEEINKHALRVISELSTYTVFGRKNIYDRTESRGYEVLSEVVEKASPLIQKRIEEIIDSFSKDELYDALMKGIEDVLQRKVFGGTP